MPRHSRLDDVTCAICMDSLFNKRDDLDDLLPVAAPDCGHVFHERCMLQWFRAQSAQYLAQAREQGLQGRRGSPSFSDAPAECPSCRAEVYADPETGEPTIHRLYIDFGDGAGHAASSSQVVGSSPIKASRKGKEKERELFALARRARGVTEEVKGLNADSVEEDVEGMLRRADGIAEDAISTKALDGVRTYIGGLTTSINNLRRTLETHQLIPILQNQVIDLKQEKLILEESLRLTLQREVRKAVEAEKAKGDQRVKKAQANYEMVVRDLEKERTLRKNSKRAHEDRERDWNVKLAEVQRQLEKEKGDREGLQDLLQDRNKQLKQLRQKVDSKRDYKARVQELEAENARLKSEAELTATKPFSQRQAFTSPLAKEMHDNDQSVQDVSGSSFPIASSARSIKHRQLKDETDADESLQVVMPSFADDSLHELSRLHSPRKISADLKYTGATSRSLKAGSSRAHPTARTIEFDLDQESAKKKRKSSKYFSDAHANVDGRDGRDKENDHPLGLGRSNGVIVEASSPSRSDIQQEYEYDFRDSPSPAKRSRTNPFASTRAITEKRKELPVLPAIPDSLRSPQRRQTRMIPALSEVIDLASSSPSPPPPPPRRRPLDKEERGRNGQGQGQMKGAVDWLGVKDSNGRPVKGLAMGQKARRLA